MHREYPNTIAHVMAGDADAAPPHVLTPAFYGCFDWHSAVHSHWALVRAVRAAPHADFHGEVRRALGRSLTREHIAGELAYARGRDGFEVPYGLSWLLQLAGELAAWDDAEARTWSATLEPLEELAATRLCVWLDKLRSPIRSGEHSQSAFAIGLLLDWARARGRDARPITERVLELHADDRDGPLHLEPSAHDFLSPCLGAADLMRRVLDADAFATWLARFLPRIELEPVTCPDPSDGKLAHLDGLNLSRAWMLSAIARALPATDERRATLGRSARLHLDAGVFSVTGEHYAGAHWLGSFALYALTS